MGEKRGREGWRKGEGWGTRGQGGCEEPKVQGDTGGDGERTKLCDDGRATTRQCPVPHPGSPASPHPSPVLVPGHLPPPTPTTTKTENKQDKQTKKRWKEGKQNIYSCRDKGRKIEANIHNFLCGALQ